MKAVLNAIPLENACLTDNSLTDSLFYDGYLYFYSCEGGMVMSAGAPYCWGGTLL